MKKFLALALALTFTVGALAGCGSSSTPAASASGSAAASSAASGELVTLKVGASPTPHAEILKQCVEPLKEQGVDLQIVEFTDYVQPNTATEDGSLDANYFQHEPYLDDFNQKQGTHLVSVAQEHYEPMGIYAGKSADLNAIADGATIAVPNDTTNEARALLLLQDNGVITLKDGAGLAATKLDIAENPHNVEIVEVEAAQLPGKLQDVDFAVINANYALQGGLKPSTDALVIESADSDAAQTYANILVVKEGNENNEAVQKLIDVLHSDALRDYITNTYDGAVVPSF
jgi:D-methionine transport system substrate-binding protein